MGGAFKIGRFSGIDVKVHWTFILLLAFFAFIGYQGSASPLGALTATLTIVALFLCVLLHEFGHSLVAQRLGIGIHSITLLPIGGVSNLESLPEKPADEVKISFAGPLVSAIATEVREPNREFARLASEEQIERTVKALEANGMAAMGSIRRNSLYTLRIGGELPLQRLGN